MRPRHLLLSACYCLLVIGLCSSYAWAQSTIVTVGPAGDGAYTYDYNTISDAVAANGDISATTDGLAIQVYHYQSTGNPVTYYESVTIDTITGADAAHPYVVEVAPVSKGKVTVSTIPIASEIPFLILGGWIRIRGFIVNADSIGIYLYGDDADDNEITGNTITQWGATYAAITLAGDAANSRPERNIIANNQIYTVTGGQCGIHLYKPAANRDPRDNYIYYNSIYVAVNTAATGYGIKVDDDASDADYIMNNAIYVTTSTNASAVAYGIFLAATTAGINSDYNCIKTKSTAGAAYVGSANGTNYQTLVDWQSGTSLDANSISYYPGFEITEGGSDLHLNHHTLRGFGTPIAAVTDDIDGDARPASKPDIGCDEIVGGSGTIGTGTYTINSGGGGNYTSIQQAAAELRERGITGDGPVTMSVTGGTTYRANIILQGITGVTSVNVVSFRNDTGGTVTVDGNSYTDEVGFYIVDGRDEYSGYRIEGFTIQAVQNQGIYLDGAWYTTIEANTITDVIGGAVLNYVSYSNIIRNKIYTLMGTSDAISASGQSTELLIANNMIYGLASAGIRVTGQLSPVWIYFNSVHVEVTGSSTKYGIYLDASSALDDIVDVYNNAIYISSLTTGVAYGIYQASSVQDSADLRSDYNDLYLAGSGGTEYTGHWAGTNYSLLSDWQGLGRDPNSIATDPTFVSSTDLHLQTGSPCIDVGVTISVINNDFDDQPRSGTPDIGCDERLFTVTVYVYSDEAETSPISGAQVRMVVLGSSVDSGATDASGYLQLYANYTENDPTLFYLDTDGGDQGCTVTRVPNGDLTDIKIYKDRFVVRNDSSAPMTNDIIRLAKASYSDTDIPYTTDSDNIIVSSGFVLWVKDGASLTINSSEYISTPSFNVASASTLTVSEDARLYSNGSSTVSGTLQLAGLSGIGRAVLAYNGANTSFDLTISGTLSATYFRVDSGRIQISDGATITQLVDGLFEYTSGLARGADDVYLDFANVTGASRDNIPYSFKGMQFDGSAGKNVRAFNTTPVITFLGPASGALWGEDYDDDPYERIGWETQVFARLDAGGDPVEYYSTLQEALGDADVTSGTVLDCAKNIIINESINLASYAKDVIIQNGAFQPSSGLVIYNSDNALRGTLRNCIITRGGVDYVTLQNCTLFRRDSSFAPLQITNSQATNVIFESGSDTTGSSFTTSFSPTSSSIFVNIDLGDFHIDPNDADAANVIDQGTDLSANFTADFEGHARGYDGDGDSLAEWDIGADEYMGTVATVNLTDCGNIRLLRFAGSRNVSGKMYAYIITSGGAANSVYDNRLLVVDLSDLSFVEDAGTLVGWQAPGPICQIGYHNVSYSPLDRRIYLAVDADNSGTPERIYCLRDTGGTLASSISVYSAFGGSGYQEYGANIGKIVAGLFPDYPPYKHRLFFVAQSALGATELYKVNIDWEDADGTDGNGVYGDTIWTNDLAAFEPNAAVNYDPVNQYLYVACSGDANNYVIVKLSAVGNVSPSIASAWSNGAANENRFGQTIIYHLIHCAPSGDNKVFSTTTSAGLDERRWTSPALAGNVKSKTFRFWATNSLMVEAGTYVYKLKDSGITNDLDNVADDPGDGEPVDPDWPRKIDGNVVSRITLSGERIYWCTTKGWVYVSDYARWDNNTSGDEDYASGYPYQFIGHKFTHFIMLAGGTWKGMYVVSDQGGIMKLPIPQ